MQQRTRIRSAAGVSASVLALAAGAYAAYAAATWITYGRVRTPPYDSDHDDLLYRFMPRYEVVERHRLYVNAPAPITLDAATEMDLLRSPLIRAIFKTRELVLGATAEPRRTAPGLLREVLGFGWGLLAEVPGHEIVVGAVTKPWEPNVTFRAPAPDLFAAFDEPGYVKIAWTLRADPIGVNQSIFRTETRAIATDEPSRRKFRLYWSAFSAGIWLIRRLSLGSLRRDAAQRARAAADSGRLLDSQFM